MCHFLTLSFMYTELYSYTEEPEFTLNRKYFEEGFTQHSKLPESLPHYRDIYITRHSVFISGKYGNLNPLQYKPFVL